MIAKTIDPRSLLGNPARKSDEIPLDLTKVFDGTAAVPTEVPYPFPPVARKLNADEHAADAQAAIDFEVVSKVVEYKADHNGAEPDAEFLQALADEGVPFTYRLANYGPAPKSEAQAEHDAAIEEEAAVPYAEYEAIDPRTMHAGAIPPAIPQPIHPAIPPVIPPAPRR